MYTVIGFSFLVAFAIYAFTSTRRKKAEPFPAHWHDMLVNHVHYYKDLSASEKKRFQDRIMLFLSEVHLDSVDIVLDDLDKILIASSALIPVFNFPEWHYKNLSTVLVYPDHFNEDLGFEQTDDKRNIAGMVGNGQFDHVPIMPQYFDYPTFISERVRVLC